MSTMQATEVDQREANAIRALDQAHQALLELLWAIERDEDAREVWLGERVQHARVGQACTIVDHVKRVVAGETGGYRAEKAHYVLEAAQKLAELADATEISGWGE